MEISSYFVDTDEYYLDSGLYISLEYTGFKFNPHDWIGPDYIGANIDTLLTLAVF